jgi:hypothetical protein
MGIKTKLTLAGGFVGVVAMAAAAFGQTGSGSETPSDGTRPSQQQLEQRRADRQQRRDERRCDGRTSRRARRLVHSDAKVKAPNGFALVTIDQGEITSIDHSAKKLTIKRLDGESVTATAVDETKVCKDGNPSAFDSLKVGDHARLVQVRSERFTGLRRVSAITPGSEPARSEPGRDGSATGFGSSEFDDLLDAAA